MLDVLAVKWVLNCSAFILQCRRNVKRESITTVRELLYRW